MKIASSPPGEVWGWVSSAPHCKGTHPGIRELAEQETPGPRVTFSGMGVTSAVEDCARSPGSDGDVQASPENSVRASVGRL